MIVACLILILNASGAESHLLIDAQVAVEQHVGLTAPHCSNIDFDDAGVVAAEPAPGVADKGNVVPALHSTKVANDGLESVGRLAKV